MGMYTEIYVNIDLTENLPEDVLYVLKGLCRDVTCNSNFDNKPFPHTPVDYEDAKFKQLIQGFGSRFDSLFSNMSYYTPNTSVAHLSFDFIGGNWSLIGKGDIKNYSDEIETFFKWVAPYAEQDFMGYMMYEESERPRLMFKSDFVEEK